MPIFEANLKNGGSEFAHVEDAVKACLRLAADDTINGKPTCILWHLKWPWLTITGRSMGIIPRKVDKEGYVDLGLDDMNQEEHKWMHLGK